MAGISEEAKRQRERSKSGNGCGGARQKKKKAEEEIKKKQFVRRELQMDGGQILHGGPTDVRARQVRWVYLRLFQEVSRKPEGSENLC